MQEMRRRLANHDLLDELPNSLHPAILIGGAELAGWLSRLLRNIAILAGLKCPRTWVILVFGLCRHLFELVVERCLLQLQFVERIIKLPQPETPVGCVFSDLTDDGAAFRDMCAPSHGFSVARYFVKTRRRIAVHPPDNALTLRRTAFIPVVFEPARPCRLAFQTSRRDH